MGGSYSRGKNKGKVPQSAHCLACSGNSKRGWCGCRKGSNGVRSFELHMSASFSESNLIPALSLKTLKVFT